MDPSTLSLIKFLREINGDLSDETVLDLVNRNDPSVSTLPTFLLYRAYANSLKRVTNGANDVTISPADQLALNALERQLPNLQALIAARG